MNKLVKIIEPLILLTNRKIGHLFPWSLKYYLYNKLYPKGGTKKPKFLAVDIVSSCNLRCPSCPVGNTGNIHSTGLMSLDMFRQVLRKARGEHGVRAVAPYNWTEPFLHPELPAFIRAAKQEKLACMISTNLNIARNIDEVIAAEPNFLRISLSGFTQEIYGKTHLRGDIEKVKENMRLLSEAHRRHGKNKTLITVFYHKYTHNLDELPLMREYAQSLGFEFEECWAYHTALEKLFEFMAGTLTEKELDFIEHMYAPPLAQAIDRASREPRRNCFLLENQIILDYQANVNLCCATYDYDNNRLGNFLHMSEADIVAAKQNHPTCAKCVGLGLDRYLTAHEIPALSKDLGAMARAYTGTGDGA